MKSETYLEYSQPDFYRFSEDSIILAKFAKDRVVQRNKLDVLDLCCGCGIVGIEFYLNFCQENRKCQLSLLEIQKSYELHIKDNLAKANMTAEIIFGDLFEITSSIKKKFDLIVCNPPFYTTDSFRPSPNRERDICRAWPSDALFKMIRLSTDLLKKKGELILVIRDISENGINRETDFLKQLTNEFQIDIIKRDKLRLVCIRRDIEIN